MATPNITFNNFGASVQKLMSFFPGNGNQSADACDFGGEAWLTEVMGQKARNIANMLKPEVHDKLIKSDLELVIQPGDANNQTTVNTAFYPIIPATMHLWRRPIFNGIINPDYTAYYDNSFWYQNTHPQIGLYEIPTTSYTVNTDTGLITLTSLELPIATFEQLIATYRIDTDNPLYCTTTPCVMASMQDMVYIFTAAQVGMKIFSESHPAWSLIKNYQTQVEFYSDAMIKGQWLPEEVNIARYFYQPTRNFEGIRTIRSLRTS